MTNPKTNQIATHIGYDVVAFGMPAIKIDNCSLRHSPAIKLMSADGEDNGAYIPAQCIVISGEDAVKQLRNFCDALLEPKAD